MLKMFSITPEMKKPEVVASGLQDAESAKTHPKLSMSLAESVNLYNTGAAMTSENNHSLELFDKFSYEIGSLEKEKPESANANSGNSGYLAVPNIADFGFSHKPEFAMSQENEYQSTRFIKYIPGEKADWLKKRNIWAFLLLLSIAERARRYEGHIDGLKIGECHIGDYKEYGIPTEQNYRTAKQILVDLKIIEIVETSRNRKKSTNGVTTKGTKVKLKDLSVWDINPELSNDQTNERPTNDQRTTNDEQEVKKDKNNKEEDKKKDTSYPKKKEPGKQAAAPSANAVELVNFFFSSLEENLPEIPSKDFKSKLNLHAKNFDVLLKIYSVEQVKKAIVFSHKDAFWRFHVHTPRYLKDKFDKLHLKANEIPQSSQASQEREWENYNRNCFFEAKKAYGKELKGIEYRNGYVINQAAGKEVSCKMHPDRFREVFASVAGVEVEEW